MFCTQCGQQIQDSSSFCPFCGTRLAAQPAPQPVQPMMQPAAQQGMIDLRGIENRDAVSMKKDPAVIGVTLVVAVLWSFIFLISKLAITPHLNMEGAEILGVMYAVAGISLVIGTGAAFLIRAGVGRINRIDGGLIALFIVFSLLISSLCFAAGFGSAIGDGLGQIVAVIMVVILLLTYLITFLIMANQLPKGIAWIMMLSFALSFLLAPLLGYLLAVIFDKMVFAAVLFLVLLFSGGFVIVRVRTES